MGFRDMLETIKVVLEPTGTIIDTAKYDGVIVKKLEASNTLDDGRSTNQTHIAITGKQMDMFPYVRADGYFEVQYTDEDPDLKKFFMAQVPAYLYKSNVEYLGGHFLQNDKELVHISIVRSRRNGAADQIQMSMINEDSTNFVSFRKLIHSGSYLIMLKHSRKLQYDVFAVKQNDISVGARTLSTYHNKFSKLSTITPVKLNEIVVDGSKSGNDEKDKVLAHNVFGMHIKEKNDVFDEANPHICIGWSDLGDLSAVNTIEELGEKYDQTWPNAKVKSRGQNVGQVWRFFRDVQKGDYVVLAENDVCHIGRVESDYYYDTNERPQQTSDYKNSRKVTWLKKNISRKDLSEAFHRSLSAAMSIWTLNDYKSAVAELLDGKYIKDEVVEIDESTDSRLSDYEALGLEERKGAFLEWFRRQVKPLGKPYGGKPYSDAVMNSFADSLEADAFKLDEFDCENKNLFYYTDIISFTQVQTAIKQAPNFDDVNKKRINKDFTCAMDRYSEFLIYLNETLDESEETEDSGDEKEVKTCIEIELSPRTNKIHPLNFILYGAPGTGKTYSTVEYALAIIENREVDLSKKSVEERKKVMATYNKFIREGRIVFTTFHQSYGYEEFIQGLRPDISSEKMSFKKVDGIFKRIVDDALNDKDNNYVIVIDEINRANISKVFGELITLIEEDKRWGEVNQTCVTLPMGDIFAVPNNLYIVGTMNSADKSISLIDTALRRRFDFVEQKPQLDLIENEKLRSLLKKMNSKLVDELDSSDLLIGHSYFMNRSEESLPTVLNNNIIPLLYEYFYDNKKKVANVLDYSIGGLTIEIVDDKMGRLSVKKKED